MQQGCNSYTLSDSMMFEYHTFGMMMPERTWSSDSVSYDFGFNGMLKDNEVYGIGNSYTAEYWQYDARLGRRWNRDIIDKPNMSVYVCFGNTPTLFIDPNGDDWFKDNDGNVQWFDNTSEGFSTGTQDNNVAWTNIGTELLEFTGDKLIYSWQTTDDDGNLQVNSREFHAVSGRPINEGDGVFRFDYSSERQTEKNIGPMPEGLYSLNKSELQLLADVPLLNRAYGLTGKGGQWKGDEFAWGRQRWWFDIENAETYNRDGFTIHGGAVWGSAGCIDLGTIGMTQFTRAIMSRSGERVYLKVDYTKPSLRLLRLNTDTWKPAPERQKTPKN